MRDTFKVNLYQLIRYFSYTTLLIFFGIYVWKVRQSRKILDLETLAIVLLLPSLILFPIHNLALIGRKDFFFLFGIVLNLFLSRKIARSIPAGDERGDLDRATLKHAVDRYSKNLFIWFNLLSIPTALSHEAILFLSVPLNMVITSSALALTMAKKQVFWRNFQIYSPTIITACLCMIFSGNEAIAIGICESWQEYKEIYQSLAADCTKELPLVLSFLKNSFRDNLPLIWSTNIIFGNGTNFLLWSFAFLTNAIVLLGASSKILQASLERGKTRIPIEGESVSLPSSGSLLSSFSFKYGFIPFLFSLILYVFALDWGRWIFITSISYVLCLLSPGPIRLEILTVDRSPGTLSFLSPVYPIYRRFIEYFNRILSSKTFYFIYLALVLYSLFLLRIPYIGIKTADLSGGFLPMLYNRLKLLFGF